MRSDHERRKYLASQILLRRLQLIQSDLFIVFPSCLPFSEHSATLWVEPSTFEHIKCTRGFIWWYMIEFGAERTSRLRAFRRYAQTHGVAISIDEDCSVTGYFFHCGLVFRRQNGQFRHESKDHILVRVQDGRFECLKSSCRSDHFIGSAL